MCARVGLSGGRLVGMLAPSAAGLCPFAADVLRPPALGVTSHPMSSVHPGQDLARQQQQAQMLDERVAVLDRLMADASDAVRLDYQGKLDLSWVHHDSALEGIVYEIPDLLRAMKGEAPTDPASVPVYDEIRQTKAAIDLVRQLAEEKSKLKIDLDVLKDLYVCLAPDEVEGKKPPAYRKDIPVHRLYFHDIEVPDKIVPRLRQFVTWLNSAEVREQTHPVRLAAKAHFQLLHIYPFPKHSGRLARLVMNLILIANGYPPAIVHGTERQRYYDALKTSDNALSGVVREALTSSLESAIRFFEQAALAAPKPVKAATPKKASSKKAPKG